MVAVLMLAAAIGLFWWWRKRRQRHRAEQALLAELDSLVARTRGSSQELAAGLHQLLRRAARRLDASAARQHGENWRQTLASLPVDAGTVETLSALEAAMYRPDAFFDSDVAVEATRRWLIAAWRRRIRAHSTSTASPAPTATESGHA
jgi:hypothetical protein